MTELRVVVPDDVAERFATAAAQRGTSTEDVAAEVLITNVPNSTGEGFGFVALFEGPPGWSAAEAERRLEDGEDGECAHSDPWSNVTERSRWAGMRSSPSTRPATMASAE